MRVLRVASQTMRGRVLPPLLYWIVCCGSLAQLAEANFIGEYSASNFAVNDLNGPGSFISPDGGFSLVMTGPNNGNGLEGYMDITTTALDSGLIRFQYTYSSLDGAGYDYAGYLIGGGFIQLADSDGQSATVLIPVNAGDIFGFRVGTTDNIGEPGVFTVFDFNGPSGGTSSVPAPGNVVPEPRSGVLVLAAMAAGLVRAKRKGRGA